METNTDQGLEVRMATLRSYTEPELLAMRDAVERRFTLQDLLDLSQMRELTCEERDALHDLQKFNFLLSGDIPADD